MEALPTQFIPRAEKQGCRARVCHERAQLPTQGSDEGQAQFFTKRKKGQKESSARSQGDDPPNTHIYPVAWVAAGGTSSVPNPGLGITAGLTAIKSHPKDVPGPLGDRPP